MQIFTPRKLIFKAWNREAKLMMRLNSIDCRRGELFKNDHVLLQFTGLYDKLDEEIYEMDVMLIGSEKFLVQWDPERSGWKLARLGDLDRSEPLLKASSEKATRLWSYFEVEPAS